MRLANVVAALLFGILVGAMIIGCQNDSPVSFQDNPVTASEPQFIKLPKIPCLAKRVEATALVTPECGGRLELNFHSPYVDSAGVSRNLDGRLSLTFRPYTVTDTLVATMSLDDSVLRSTVDITFGPHGSTFLRPALLDVDVKGIDLSDLRPHDRVYLWYIDNGKWIRMDAKKITVNIRRSELKCDDAELPHFSAYAFGRAPVADSCSTDN